MKQFISFVAGLLWGVSSIYPVVIFLAVFATFWAIDEILKDNK